MSLTVTRNYQATVILDTRKSEDPVQSLVDKISDLLKELGADVTKVENLGHKDFVSGAVKRHAGDIFVYYEFSGSGEIPGQLEFKTRLDKTIKRLHVNRR